jgi:hypothetical protein
MRPAVAERAALEQPSTIPTRRLFRVKFIHLSKLPVDRRATGHFNCRSSNERCELVGIFCSHSTAQATAAVQVQPAALPRSSHAETIADCQIRKDLK